MGSAQAGNWSLVSDGTNGTPRTSSESRPKNVAVTYCQYNGTGGAGGGVTANSLDFTDFKDAMALDASTDISIVVTNVLSVINAGTGLSLRVNDDGTTTESTPFAIDASGNVGIGTTSPGYKLDVNGTSNFGGLITYNGATPSTGTYYACVDSGLAIRYQTSCTSSSRRFEHNIEPLPSSDMLAAVLKLQPVSFHYNADYLGRQVDREKIGFVAEDVASVDSRLSVYEKDGKTVRSLDYDKVSVLVVGAVKKLKAANDNQATELRAVLNALRDEFRAYKVEHP